MGEAQRRLTEGSKVVTVDLTAPVLSIMKGDRDVLTKETISGLTPDQTATSKAVRLAISAVVQASFPQGMAKADRRIWSAWLEVLEEEETVTVAMPWAQAEWLKKLLSKEDLKLQPSLAQWCDALEDYLEKLYPTVGDR